jgi:hypothetical protein
MHEMDFFVKHVSAFTHWLYYAEPDFIKKAWASEPMMAKHLQEKLYGFIARDPEGIMGLQTLIKWHQELTVSTAQPLYKYILANHAGKWRNEPVPKFEDQYPDTEAGGFVFCGKCGKVK